MVFCLSLLAYPPQSLQNCPSTLTKVLLQQMLWILVSPREHMQKFFWDDIKTPLLLCQYIKKGKTLFLKLLTIQNCSCSLNLPCLLPSSRRNQGKRTKPPLTSTTHNQILALVSTNEHIFSVSPSSGSVENDFTIE